MPYKVKTLSQRRPRREYKRQTIAVKIRNSGRWRRFRSWYRTKHPVCVDPIDIHPGEVRPVAQVHHVKAIIEHPELAFCEDNCLSVCTQCHAAIEKQEMCYAG